MANINYKVTEIGVEYFLKDFVDDLETFADSLSWSFSYGNKSNQNLLSSDREDGKIYLLLDPITRNKAKSEYGGDGIVTYSGQFLLVVKSNLDNVYHNQKNKLKEDGKYKKNIQPLLKELYLLEKKIDCSEYAINEWLIMDVINALDVNTDGLVISFKISSL